ncbi:hypothetical protein [Terrabacter sp. 2RAF25]|uniref:hypothetical protein n=1 Tax=Terrabacter sp. 2RAF25 TaxID=3232998 RepID=UPI003F9DE000
MRRPTTRNLLVAVTPLTLLPCLAACSDPAATMPVAVPSTTGVATTRAASAASDEPLAPPSSLTPPRVHATGAVAAHLDGYDVAGLTRSTAEGPADLAACPDAARLTKVTGPDAYARSWQGPAATRADVAAITYPDLASAARAVEPVLDAAASCRAPKPHKGITTTVDNERRDVAEGMPLGRVDLTRTSAAGTVHDYVGVVQVGNVGVRLTFSSPDGKAANEKGSTALARLARDVQGL